jgi:hypothetical protein
LRTKYLITDNSKELTVLVGGLRKSHGVLFLSLKECCCRSCCMRCGIELAVEPRS